MGGRVINLKPFPIETATHQDALTLLIDFYALHPIRVQEGAGSPTPEVASTGNFN